jgi:DNA uptake protein ComE-like DNA-binding protein
MIRSLFLSAALAALSLPSAYAQADATKALKSAAGKATEAASKAAESAGKAAADTAKKATPRATTPAKPEELSASDKALLAHGEKEAAKLSPTQQSKLLDLVNKAEQKDLTAIPGVGEVKSGNIVAKRPVRNVADLIMIDGIGESTFDGIIKWVKDGMKAPEPSAKPAATTKPEPKATKEAKPAPAKEDAPTRKPASTKEAVKDAVKEATKPEVKETPSRRKAS